MIPDYSQDDLTEYLALPNPDGYDQEYELGNSYLWIILKIYSQQKDVDQN